MNIITQYFNFASGEMLPVNIESDDHYIDATVNIKDLMWRINHSLTASLFRIFILYPDETIKEEIPRDKIKAGGTYNENYQNGQRRSLSFTIYNQGGEYTPDINKLWAGTKLRFDVGIKISEHTTYWFQKGIFVITNTTPVLSPNAREVQITAKDKFGMFEDNTGKLESTYEIKYGNNIKQILNSILFKDLGNGFVFDPKPMLYQSTLEDNITQVTISKNAGDTLGAILLELATQLSAEIFYNGNGNLVVTPISDVTYDADKPLLCNYNTLDGEINGLSFNLDYNTIINKIIVMGASNETGTHIAEAVNDDSQSPLCYQRIGLRTGNIINDPNIYSTPLAQERADYELRQQLILKSSVSATVRLNPFLEVNNLISITDTFFELSRERFLLQSISFSLDNSNQMNITFSNLKNLPFIVS